MDEVSDRIRIVVADDHALFREGLKELLAIEDDFAVVGEAGDGEEAVAVVVDTQPDIVLLDVEMPGSGVTATVRRIRSACAGCRVIILTMYDGAQLVRELLPLGISGYLVKNVTRHELGAAIRDAHGEQGHTVVSVSRRALIQSPPGSARGATLSPRELEVLGLASRAMSNAQIARQLFLSEATVKRHLRNVFAKLAAVSRIDAVNKAIEAALLPPPRARVATVRGPEQRPWPTGDGSGD